jgi:hypothetical protein
MAASRDAVWLSRGLDVLTRVDARTGRAQQLVVGSSGGLAYDGRYVWSVGALHDPANPSGLFGVVWRIDPRSGAVTAHARSPDLGPGSPSDAIAADASEVWGVSEGADAAWRLDAVSVRVTSVLPVPHRPAYVALGAGAVWTANDDGTVSRIDRTTSDVGTIPLGRYPRVAYPIAIAVGAGLVWVPVR